MDGHRQIAGLGNLDMINTRHSMGMRFVNRLAQHLSISWEKQRKLNAFIARKNFDMPPTLFSPEPVSLDLVLLKSTLPMNLNGRSIKSAADAFSVGVQNIYLVHDELDKPVGKFGIKEGGSARGHNGVRSVTSYLHTDNTVRLRIGVDRPNNPDAVADYVLSRFNEDEEVIIERQTNQAISKLLSFIESRLNLDKDTLEKRLSNAS